MSLTYTSKGAQLTRALIKQTLVRHGFNVDRYPHVSCSACAVLVINSMPCHETGCPNAMHECNGCNAIVPVRVRYCEDCR